MLKFLLRRFANYLVLVAIATTAGFFLASETLNPRSRYDGQNPPPPEAAIDAKLDAVNMNDKTPTVERYKHWVSRALHLDFGRTINDNSINEEMRRRIGVSLRLLLIGAILGSTLGVALGAFTAVRQYRPSDHIATVSSFLLLSTPVFLLGILLKLLAYNVNQRLGTNVFFYVGEFDPRVGGIVDRIQHLIMPTLAITLPAIAAYSRYQRSSMLDVLGGEYLRTAQAKGLRRRQALIRHGLRTALIPMGTFFAYGFVLLFTGAAFTEKIYGWHGMGEWFIDAIYGNDTNVVVAVTAFSGFLVLIAGMLSDLVTAALDPRVRLQ